MDERQKLQSDLTRYWTLRGLVSDEQALQAIQQLIREAEDRLVQISPGSQHPGLKIHLPPWGKAAEGRNLTELCT
jgi:hypothetical protein